MRAALQLRRHRPFLRQHWRAVQRQRQRQPVRPWPQRPPPRAQLPRRRPPRQPLRRQHQAGPPRPPPPPQLAPLRPLLQLVAAAAVAAAAAALRPLLRLQTPRGPCGRRCRSLGIITTATQCGAREPGQAWGQWVHMRGATWGVACRGMDVSAHTSTPIDPPFPPQHTHSALQGSEHARL